MKTVRKAVIPVAGLGTRMLPASKAIPKEMLPLADKPLIQYIVQECADAGIREIVLVTHSSKNSIENHFDRHFELESMLERRLKRQLLDDVQSICPEGVTLIHVRQGEALGLGHAISCAYPVIGDQPFAVLLPDMVMEVAADAPARCSFAGMVAAFAEDSVSRILVEEVALQDTGKYGIVALAEGEGLEPGEHAITHVVEKPAPAQAPSRLAVNGRYVLSEKIWPYFFRTPKGHGGEIQLSDTLDIFLREHPVHATVMAGRSLDCGDKLGYFKAFVEYSARHPECGDAFRAFLKGFVG